MPTGKFKRKENLMKYTKKKTTKTKIYILSLKVFKTV